MSIAQSTTLFAGRLRNRHAPVAASPTADNLRTARTAPAPPPGSPAAAGARPRQQAEGRARDRGRVLLAVAGGEHPVGLAPDHQRVGGDPGQPPGQARVGHRGAAIGRERRPVAAEDRALRVGQRRQVDPVPLRVGPGELGDLVERERGEVRRRMLGADQPGPVDDDQPGHPVGRGQRELGRDPAADRVARDGHAGQVELRQQAGVDLGQLADGIESLRARRAAEPGVDRGQHADREPGRQLVGEPGEGIGPGPAVQQHDRCARAALGDGDGNVSVGHGQRVGTRGHCELPGLDKRLDRAAIRPRTRRSPRWRTGS